MIGAIIKTVLQTPGRLGTLIWRALCWIWTRTLPPVFSALGKAGKWAFDHLKRLWTALKSLPGRIKTSIENFQRWMNSKRAPLLLSEGGMLLQLSCQFAIITTLLLLLKRSNRDKGIATVVESEAPYYDARGFQSAPIVSLKFVWSTVPAWIISAYSALWSAMLESLKAVHRDLELYKDEQKPTPGSKALGKLWQSIYSKFPLPASWRRRSPSPPSQVATVTHSTAKRTMLLDYGEWPVWSGFKAMRAGHVLLGICMCLRAALWTAGGLSAAIFDVADVPFQTGVSLYSDTFFDEYLGFAKGEDTTTRLPLPAFDVVSATLIRGGQNLSWTTGTHSFLPYLPSQLPSRSSSPGNYTFDTEAYWASIECDFFSGDRLRKEGALTQALRDPELGSAQMRLGYSHAGCKIEKWFNVFNVTTSYGRSFSTTECGLASGRARIGFFTGRYRDSRISDTDNFALTEMVILTCKPDFHRSNVTVTVSISESETPGRKPVAQILDFKEKAGSRETFWPFFFSRFLRDLPTFPSDSRAVTDADSFARLVIDHASDRPRLDYIPAGLSLLHSFEAVFRGVYSNYVSLMAYSDATRREAQGTLAHEEVRLYVSYKATYAVVAIVVAAFLTTLFLAISLFRNRHIIRGHQELMLGTALLLRDMKASGVSDYLDEVRTKAAAAQTPDANPVKVAEKSDDLSKWEAWADKNGVMQMRNPLGASPGSSPTAAPSPSSGLGALPIPATQPPTQSNTGGIPLQNLTSSGQQVPNP